MELYCNRGGLAVRRLGNFIAIQLLYCRKEKAIGIVLQYNCCIVIRSVLQQAGGWGQIVSQYTRVYCDQVREISRAVLQYSHCTCDTALGWARGTCATGAGARTGRAGGIGVGRWVARSWGAGTTQRRGGARQAQGRAGGRWGTPQAQGRAGERQGRVGRPAGRACAHLGVLSWARLGVLCTLTHFLTRFDSVLFLSH